MRVLIVDDEPLARERLRRLLGELPGYEVAGEAADGENALRLIEREEPDVVLLDIRMGGAIDGLQVARRVAEDDFPPGVIFVTAYPEHALSAFDARGAAYLLKPVRREKLADALQHLLGTTGWLQALQDLPARLEEQAARIAAHRGTTATEPADGQLALI